MTTQGCSITFKIYKKYLEGLLTIIDGVHFRDYLKTMVSKVFWDGKDVFEEMMKNPDEYVIPQRKSHLVYYLFCVIIRYIKEFHTRVEMRLHRHLEVAEDEVSKGELTEQSYIRQCDFLKKIKEFINIIVECYEDDKDIYFVSCPDNKNALTIFISSLPCGDDFIEYMFNFVIERRRCIATLIIKQKQDELNARQAADDEALIQAFEEQKTKEKKQTIQDLTRKANKKKANEQRLRKEFEKSAAEKELEKAKDKKKKQKKSKA